MGILMTTGQDKGDIHSNVLFVNAFSRLLLQPNIYKIAKYKTTFLPDPRNPRNTGSIRAPQDNDVESLRRPEETSLNRLGTGQQPAYHVLRRAYFWSGQLLLLPMYIAAGSLGQGRQDYHLYYTSAVCEAV